MATDFEIKGEWIGSESGQKYIAKAVGRTGRILAKATVDLPIDVGVDFVSFYGPKLAKETIEDAAREQVRLLADATPGG